MSQVLDDESLDDEAPVPARGRSSRTPRSARAKGQNWSRLIHVYLSMVCFMVVLFFSVTGLTLNHPTWSFGGDSEITVEGTMPTDWQGGATVDRLATAEFLRAEHNLRGSVSEFDSTEADTSLTFKGPGYSADAFIDNETGAYDVLIVSAGPLGVANDLHKGRDSASSWRWLVDASAILLILISFSGLILQLYLRRRRRSALWSVAGGTVLLALFTLLALR